MIDLYDNAKNKELRSMQHTILIICGILCIIIIFIIIDSQTL